MDSIFWSKCKICDVGLGPFANRWEAADAICEECFDNLTGNTAASSAIKAFNYALAKIQDVFDQAGKPSVVGKCEFCGRLNENDPSDFYHRSDCESRYIRELISKETDPQKIEELEKRLERARYTGD